MSSAHTYAHIPYIHTYMHTYISYISYICTHTIHTYMPYGGWSKRGQRKGFQSKRTCNAQPSRPRELTQWSACTHINIYIHTHTHLRPIKPHMQRAALMRQKADCLVHAPPLCANVPLTPVNICECSFCNVHKRQPLHKGKTCDAGQSQMGFMFPEKDSAGKFWNE